MMLDVATRRHGWGVDTLLGTVFGPQEESLLTGRRQDRAAPLGCNKWNVKRSSRRTSLKGANIRRIEKLNDPALPRNSAAFLPKPTSNHNSFLHGTLLVVLSFNIKIFPCAICKNG